MAENLATVTDDTFEAEVVKSDLPVLVDFWAVWCVPCRALTPHVEAIAAELKDKLKVFKMDVDASPKTPARFGVRGIPTLLFFKGGELKEQIVGVLPKDKIVAQIAKHLPPS